MKLPYLWITLLALSGCVRQPSADLIVTGGTIYTMDDRQPVAEAVVVHGDKITFVGSMSESEKWRGDRTQLIDLDGKTMTPGFIEGHGHLMGLGFSELNLNLADISSYEEMVERVKDAVSKSTPGQWIVGQGWHQDKWVRKPKALVKGFQTHHALSAVSPENPVYLRHASGHAGFANARAMQIAGVNPMSLEHLEKDLGDGGEIVRDRLGNPTGIFNERAQFLITRQIPERDSEVSVQALELAMAACVRNGITGFHDAGATRESIELFKRFNAEKKLRTRLYVMLTGFDRRLVYDWFRRGPEVDTSHWLTIRSVKLNCDGALGTRGAWLLEPYSDRPDFSGMATLPMDTVVKTCREALKAGFQVCAHAIGDRANREVLDRYEQAFNENPAKASDHRFRIEHAQHLHPDDIPRFAKLGVVASMEAIHLSSDRPWAIERLGEKRIVDGAYKWQSLLKSGARVVNGTDVPVEPIDPVACFYAAVTRKTLAGTPVGGYEPAERMTRAQALRSYTLDAAYAAFEENFKGSIEEGKLADFTVFSKDLMKVPEDDILKTSIEMTIVGGTVVYAR